MLGLPLGSPGLKVAAAAMLNVVGAADGALTTTLAPVARALALPAAAVHWYNSTVKVASWGGHSRPPQTHLTAYEGSGLPSALLRTRPASSFP